MRARAPYLIVAAICAALVAIIEPAPAGSAERPGAREAHGGDAVREGWDADWAADWGPARGDRVAQVAPAAVLSSLPEQPVWATPAEVLAASPSSSPDGARLFLAGLILVSLAAAARRG